MDAQNAAGSDKTKPSASESKRSGNEPAESAAKSTSPAKTNLAASTAKESKSKAAEDDSTVTVTADDGANSDAETVVLAGKDGHSPSKARKVKHEHKSDEEGTSAAAGVGPDSALSHAMKKKRLQDRMAESTKAATAALNSGPKNMVKDADHSDSESDGRRTKSPKLSKDKPRSVDKGSAGHKRKAPKPESDDETEAKRARRQRSATGRGDGLAAKTPRDQRPTKSADQPDRRSISPHHRHRRSISTQLPLSNGLSHKKKRIPAQLPLGTHDYHSDESSSGRDHPRSSRGFHGMTTPATADSTASPAKMAPQKKHLDAHGQTYLARACAKGEYDIAKQRLQERPDDLNVADYAGNTPLQIAAINGSEDIVRLLIEAGCNLDCVNYDKDTPLLDAVDNGHLGVVKLLLDAGVNPRKANVNGEEPIDRISDDLENAEEIRAALQQARQQMGDRRRTSEEHHVQERPETRDSHGPESPRRSPQATAAAIAGRQPRTVRATKTSNHLLYMPMDEKTLRQAAGRGDQETVMRILEVKPGCDDPEAMVNAARGGHEVVLQYLLALGGANPDPPPLDGMPAEVATPMLAAIGQENIKVIELLLEQTGFNPTQRIKGETYYEIARRRQGTHWKEEETILKNAYDAYRKKHKDSGSAPSKKEREREREAEREAKRASRLEAKEEATRVHKRNLSSPSRESESRKKAAKAAAATSLKEKKRSNSFTQHEERTSPKRGPGRPRKEAPAVNVSRESSPALHRTTKVKRAESDVAGASSEGEVPKPRRKLVSKGELNKDKGEREKKRAFKNPSSPRTEEHQDKEKVGLKSDKHLDRAKAIKRDESRDRLSVSGESTTKRHHSSSTPPPSSVGDKDDSEAPPKRRRLDADAKERRQKLASATMPVDDQAVKANLPRETSVKIAKKAKRDDDERREGRTKKSDSHRRESAKSSSSEKSIHVKCEDVEMEDAAYKAVADEAVSKAKKEAEEAAAAAKEAAAKEAAAKEAAAREEEEARRRELEEREKEKRRREELEAKKREEERKKKAAEEERRRKAEEEERQRKEEEERKRREDEERERKRREEEEKRRIEEEERRKAEEERERRQKAEEERLRREQEAIQRRLAEASRKKAEERAAREAEQRRIREEQERIRLDKLPGLFRWFDQCPNPKTPELAQRFSKLLGFRYETLNPDAAGTAEAKELWTLNLSAALLLGSKDLSLSGYTGWERTPASTLAKRVIWAIMGSLYSLQDWSDLGHQLPNYYGVGVTKPGAEALDRVRSESFERFMNMDLFFVKISDLMYLVPNFAHLRGVKVTVTYKELPASLDDWKSFKRMYKWKQDPEYKKFLSTGFGPRDKYYVNGVHIGDEDVDYTPVSKTPFPEPRYPRRHGLYRVYPGDADFEKLCRAQGLEHLIKTPSQSPSLLQNGFPSPSMNHGVLAAPATGQAVNGTSPALPTNSDVPRTLPPQPPNGVNGVTGRP